jgi:histidinol dehydrogenase
MARRLDSRDRDFEAEFRRFLADKRETAADVNAVVAEILAGVRARGDDAVIDYTARFDRVQFRPDQLRFGAAEIEARADQADPGAVAALAFAAERIEAFHRRQMPPNFRQTDAAGVDTGQRWNAISAVGIYVPGGLAAYPSSLLMNALPARVAGVERIAMMVPTPDGKISPLVLAAARLAGIEEIYRLGGAQAIAALAYGTETVQPVAKIVGPGNAYVAAAKMQVFGTVGIDMIAGPSEILVLADGENNPEWIAIDLLSQAEHDEAAQAILMTDDAAFADAVAAALEAQLESLPRADIARKSWADFGAIITVESLEGAVALIDRVAPEHLEIATGDARAEALAAAVHDAGAIFLGRFSPEAVGDYVAGPNHVLPTARSARYASGLSVYDFMKRTNLIRCDQAALRAIGPAAIALAEAEGLPAHARSIAIRLEDAE